MYAMFVSASLTSTPHLFSAGIIAALVAVPLITATWPQMIEAKRKHPKVARLIIAAMLACGPVLTVAADEGGILLPTCSSKWITLQCGEGESWCRTLLELECWLAGFGVL